MNCEMSNIDGVTTILSIDSGLISTPWLDFLRNLSFVSFH